MNGAERISPYGLGVVYSRAGPSRTWNVVFPEVSRPPCSSCCNAGERVTARDLPFVTTFEDPFRQTSRRSLVATSLLPKEIRSAASQSRAFAKRSNKIVHGSVDAKRSRMRQPVLTGTDRRCRGCKSPSDFAYGNSRRRIAAQGRVAGSRLPR
jgi:hypothetical protein